MVGGANRLENDQSERRGCQRSAISIKFDVLLELINQLGHEAADSATLAVCSLLISAYRLQQQRWLDIQRALVSEGEVRPNPSGQAAWQAQNKTLALIDQRKG